MVADIYSPSGQLLISIDGGSDAVGHTVSMTLTNSGTFTIMVHESLYRATATYYLTIQSSAVGGCNSRTISCGQTVTTNTSLLTEMHAYNYTGTAGQQLTFAFYGAIAGADCMLADIYSPSGQLLTSIDGGSDGVGHTVSLTLTNSGTFTIMVHRHPPGFDKKVLGWRFGPATRQG
jgi:ribosomal protein S6E (S10)